MAARKKKPDEVTTFRFEMEGKRYEIDPADLTWGEIEDLELFFGESYDTVDLQSGRGVMFLAYIARRRIEPKFTLDMMRALRVSTFAEASAEAHPTQPGDATAGTPS